MDHHNQPTGGHSQQPSRADQAAEIYDTSHGGHYGKLDLPFSSDQLCAMGAHPTAAVRRR